MKEEGWMMKDGKCYVNSRGWVVKVKASLLMSLSSCLSWRGSSHSLFSLSLLTLFSLLSFLSSLLTLSLLTLSSPFSLLTLSSLSLLTVTGSQYPSSVPLEEVEPADATSTRTRATK